LTFSAVRLILPKCYFDETKCAVGLDALRQYRRQFNARMNEFTGEPVHDKFSHASDALRGFAVTHKPQLPEPPDEPWMTGYTSIPHPLAWMGG